MRARCRARARKATAHMLTLMHLLAWGEFRCMLDVRLAAGRAKRAPEHVRERDGPVLAVMAPDGDADVGDLHARCGTYAPLIMSAAMHACKTEPRAQHNGTCMVHAWHACMATSDATAPTRLCKMLPLATAITSSMRRPRVPRA